MAKKSTPAPAPATTPRRRRLDADRSVAAILAAALEALAGDPDASMAEIARRAGVVRATIYVHFPTRETLLDAVMEKAVAEVAEAAAEAEPQLGEPAEALVRVLRATWQKLDLFQSLLTINTNRLSAEELHRRHLPVLEHYAPLIERGQKAGVFRSDLPVKLAPGGDPLARPHRKLRAPGGTDRRGRRRGCPTDDSSRGGRAARRARPPACHRVLSHLSELQGFGRASTVE